MECRIITPFEDDSTVDWKTRLWKSLVNAAIVLLCIIVITVTFVLLYKYRFYKVGMIDPTPYEAYTLYIQGAAKKTPYGNFNGFWLLMHYYFQVNAPPFILVSYYCYLPRIKLLEQPSF